MMATQRVRRLRDAALSRNVRWSWQRELFEGEAWMQTVGDLWWIRRKGHKDAHILRNLDVVIDPDELIVGKATQRAPDADEAARLEKARQFMSGQPRAVGQNGHMTIDYEKLLAVGCRGVQDEIDARIAKLKPSRPKDQRKTMFLKAAREALEGVCDLARRYAEHARALIADEQDPTRRAELLEIADICERVPAGPADTFREALQSVHLLTFAIQYADNIILMCPGRMDRWLNEFYQRDLAEGRITPEQAQELIDCFYIMINEIVPRGLAVGVMVGGQDADGQDMTNPVSHMCLQAVENTALIYPTLGICWHEGTPDDLLDLGCRLMAGGRANPAVFNDDVISRGLLLAGVSEDRAHEYINSTCVEISPIASSNVWVASPYFNLTGLLLETISAFVAEGKKPSFRALWSAYRKRVANAIQDAVTAQNEYRESRERFGGYPLLSCFVNDCLERGLDIDHGGAKHNWIECSFVGLANVVDSLMVIREFVYEQKNITLAGLKTVLDSDFAECEDTRQCFLNHPAKYGNDHEEADALAREFTEFLTRECLKHRVRLNDRFYPGFFCWIMHERLGAETGASPDGRRAGVAFADGAGPAQGRERKGPTAAVKSTTKWDHTPCLGGLVLNLKFSPKALTNDVDRWKLAELIKAYMRLGGQEVQVNCVSRETLLAAREKPEEYRDLVVRIAGYTDYFTGLAPGMQDEVISRTEFGEV